MSEKILLSFVVPVYNVEKYLNECLDSIFDPSVDEDEYEVIAVDDGSTDSSPEILKTYCRHKNFRIITQENAGQGPARNIGIKAAKGRYIYFIDSDDYLLPGAVPVLLGLADESDSDIIEFDNLTTDETGNQIGDFKTIPNRMPREGRGKDLFVDWCKQSVFFDVVWIRLYRKAFIINNSLFFMVGILHEDTEWQYRCFFLAETVAYHPVTIYIYRRRAGSLSYEKDELKRCCSFIKILDCLVSFRKTISVNDDNAAYLTLQGDFIARNMERMVNFLYKSADLRCQKEQLFDELKKRRNLLGFAASKKGRLMYMLTRWLPAKMAFRMYKIF